MSDEPTWTERVDEQAGHIIGSLGEWVPANFARAMAAILDDPQRQEDEEVGRLLREMDGADVKPSGDGWRAGKVVPAPLLLGGRGVAGRGPTPVEALRDLRGAIGGEA